MRCLHRPLRAFPQPAALLSGGRPVHVHLQPSLFRPHSHHTQKLQEKEQKEQNHSKEQNHHHHHPDSRDPPPLRDEDIVRLAQEPLHQLRLADLVKHGWPPLSQEALLQSANFSLELIPVRLARRLQALRSLPYIVVSNRHVRQIYQNYRHSLRALLPLWLQQRRQKKAGSHSPDADGGAIATLDDEIAFTESLADLVRTHQNTIPFLAQGFLECRKYMAPADVTAFLDEHLRARIGTRLIAEQHIALHCSPRAENEKNEKKENEKKEKKETDTKDTYIGVIDTLLCPAQTVDSCAGFVADICELQYGVRPEWRIDGEPATTFAYVPMHLEYIVTELLKNAFRAVVENKRHREPVVITIAPEPPLAGRQRHLATPSAILPLDDNAPGVTIRIRDRGGGISPEVLPSIWSYSFTTFSPDPAADAGLDDGTAGLSILTAASQGGSSIAGLGYGLPLSRAYAEFFGGGIDVQSLYGWGTDVYLRLKGVGNIE